MSSGRVLKVYKNRLGCAVSTTVVGDNTTKVIPVDAHIVRFDEEGGEFLHQPTGDVYTYTEADSDLETITLAAGLPVGKTLSASDALYVYPRADDYYADVPVDDVATDVVAARVPKMLRTILAEGDANGESVRLQPSGEEWEILGLVGEEPTIVSGGLPLIRANGFSRVKLARTTAVSVAGGTPTGWDWSSSSVDTDNYWSLATANRIIVPFTGQYDISVTVIWADSGGNNRRALWIEGSPDNSVWTVLPAAQEDRLAVVGDPTACNMSGTFDTTEGHFLRIRVEQNSGGNLNMNTARLSMKFLGPS